MLGTERIAFKMSCLTIKILYYKVCCWL